MIAVIRNAPVAAVLLLIFLGCCAPAYADKKAETETAAEKIPEQTWGIAVGVRSASIIFDADDDVVSSFVPLLFFKGEHFYLDGLEGGVHVYEHDNWQFDVFGRLRFFDIDKQYQNAIQGDTADVGGRITYAFDRGITAGFEFLSDKYGNTQSILEVDHRFSRNGLQVNPFINLRYKDSGFNSRYYGLEWLGNDSLDGGVDAQAGLRLTYHVISNLYLIGWADARWLDQSVRDSPISAQDWEATVFGGIGFSNEKPEQRRSDIGITPYFRLSHCWATPSSIGDILSGTLEDDEFNHQMTSLFYGYPLTDRLFTLPVELYLTSGLAHHYSSEVQAQAQELILAIKAYYTIKLPVRLRLGFAEGFSYITDVSYTERTKSGKRGDETSNLMNYLDFSLDVNVGDLIRSSRLKDLWFGAAVHHRSAIFESAQQFGRISGGSNYPSMYLQYHF